MCTRRTGGSSGTSTDHMTGPVHASIMVLVYQSLLKSLPVQLSLMTHGSYCPPNTISMTGSTLERVKTLQEQHQDHCWPLHPATITDSSQKRGGREQAATTRRATTIPMTTSRIVYTERAILGHGPTLKGCWALQAF